MTTMLMVMVMLIPDLPLNRAALLELNTHRLKNSHHLLPKKPQPNKSKGHLNNICENNTPSSA